MRTFLTVCVIARWAVTAAAVSAAEPVVLIDQGQPRCAIVVPDGASATERHAAKELARYLHEISGATVPIMPEGAYAGGTRIDVGMTSVARARLPASLQGNAESILLHADDHGVVLCGGSYRGTLFAVYRFLETSLGCRWLAPDGDRYVPHRRTIAVAAMHVESVPAFDLRTFISRADAASMAWGPQLGLNGFYTAAVAGTNGGCYYLPPELPGCHTYYQVIRPDKFFARHPEWFALVGDSRRPRAEHGRQLCVTADGLADQFAESIKAIFTRHPDCRITSISPNDGYGWCQCEQCQALDRKLCGGRTTRQGLAADRPFRGDRVFWFANEVARRVAEEYPDRLLLVLAYVNYAEPPDTVRPLPNVVPWLCHYAPADYSRPIADRTSSANRQFNRLLKRWAEIAPQLLFYFRSWGYWPVGSAGPNSWVAGAVGIQTRPVPATGRPAGLRSSFR